MRKFIHDAKRSASRVETLFFVLAGLSLRQRCDSIEFSLAHISAVDFDVDYDGGPILIGEKRYSAAAWD